MPVINQYGFDRIGIDTDNHQDIDIGID